MSQITASKPATTKAKEGFLQRFLDPIDRITEAIYAVLIVMTFTMAYRAIDASAFPTQPVSQLVTQLAIAAFGCAVAWGIIDGAMFILLSMLERGENTRLLTKMKKAPNEQAAIGVISDHFDESLETIMSEEEREQFYQQAYLRLRDNEPKQIGFKREEFLGALGVLLIAIIVTLPVVLPLIIFRTDANLALRASNLMAIVMLFIFGDRWAKYAGSNRLKMGLLLAGLGVAMVLVAIPLGG